MDTDTYTNLSQDLISKYLTSITATCEAQTSNLLVCNMNNIKVRKCNVDFTCENDGSVKTQTCSPDQIVAALSQAVDSLSVPVPDDVTAGLKTLTAGMGPAGTTAPAQTVTEAMTRYMTTRCSQNASTQQTVSIPQLYLDICKNDVVTLLNQLDEDVRCTVSAISEMIPLDALPTQYPVPTWDKPTDLSWVVTGSVLVMVAVAFLLSGFVLKTRAGWGKQPKAA
jgi:hypothetical protein